MTFQEATRLELLKAEAEHRVARRRIRQATLVGGVGARETAQFAAELAEERVDYWRCAVAANPIA